MDIIKSLIEKKPIDVSKASIDFNKIETGTLNDRIYNMYAILANCSSLSKEQMSQFSKYPEELTFLKIANNSHSTSNQISKGYSKLISQIRQRQLSFL